MADLVKLIREGRLQPITKSDAQGNVLVVGYHRNKRSRKANKTIWLKKPYVIETAAKVEALTKAIEEHKELPVVVTPVDEKLEETAKTGFIGKIKSVFKL